MATEWQKTGERAYFAAANTKDGFRSYYNECIRDRVDHLFCVKGGPGTGKSRLLREIARAGALAGWRVETYYCSSDPQSLDGVLLSGDGRMVALVDATAPHVVEPRLPGLREDIVDLGQFWDGRQLAERAAEIVVLNEQKARAYRMAYRSLDGAGKLTENIAELTDCAIDTQAIRRAAERLLRDVPPGERFECVPGLTGAIGMRGRVRLDTYLRLGRRVCFIEDYYDTGYLLTRAILDAAQERRLSCRVSFEPLCPDHIDAISIEGDGTVFFVGTPDEGSTFGGWRPARVIRMRQKIDAAAFRAVREEVRYAARLREALIEDAVEHLADARQAHFALEAIYEGAMDFAAKERFTQELAGKILGGG